MHGQVNLERVKLIVPVIDLAHVGPTINNLANVSQTYRVKYLDIQIEVDPTKFPNTDPNDNAAVQKVLDDATALLNQTNAELESAIPKENK